MTVSYHIVIPIDPLISFTMNHLINHLTPALLLSRPKDRQTETPIEIHGYTLKSILQKTTLRKNIMQKRLFIWN